MLLAILLDLCQEQSLLDAEEKREKLDLVVYSMLKLLLAAGHLLGSGPRA
jgi:hypothetical protein